MVCHLLDKYNMDVNCNNNDFRDFFHDAKDSGSPLCSAVLHRNLAVVLELLQRGADPSESYSEPVSNAVKADGFVPALELLLCAGADPNKALLSAVHCINFDAVKVCMEFGADPAPALPRALEQEEGRVDSVARNAAYFERQPDEDVAKDERLEEKMATERNSKAILEMLRSAMKTSPQ
jgi:ankyrin repeat protein